MIKIKDIWEYDYSWISIDLDIDENIKLDISEDIVNASLFSFLLRKKTQNSLSGLSI